MKNKKVLILLAMTVVLSSAMTACNFGGGNDDDSVVVQVTPTPEPTKAPKVTPTQAPADAQNTIYTSKNKEVSIKLPDATWANKSDSDDMISFESPKQGKLLILHGSGDEDMSVAIIPSTEDTAKALVKADNLEEGTDFEIQDYKAEEVNGVSVYTYTIHYLNDKSEYAYVVNKYITDNTSEFYSIAASAKTDSALTKLKTSVDSFKISGDSVLKAGAQGNSDTKTDAANNNTAGGSTDTAGTSSTSSTDGSTVGSSSSDGSASGTTDSSYSTGTSDYYDDYSGDYSYDSDSSYSGSSYDYDYNYDDGSSGGYFADGTPVGTDDPDYDTDRTRTIYRNSDGYPLVIYPNGDGTWCDDDGNNYDFVNGEDVYDENGVDYYYHGEPAYVRYMPKN